MKKNRFIFKESSPFKQDILPFNNDGDFQHEQFFLFFFLSPFPPLSSLPVVYG